MKHDYCPICGIDTKEVGYSNHKCSKRVLGAIDAARTRLTRKPELLENITQPTFSTQLKDASQMINPDIFINEREGELPFI